MVEKRQTSKNFVVVVVVVVVVCSERIAKLDRILKHQDLRFAIAATNNYSNALANVTRATSDWITSYICVSISCEF